MTDVTETMGKNYLAIKKTLEDLNRLGADFGEALREAGSDFTDAEEYSLSAASLVLKKSHAWFFSAVSDGPTEKAAKVLRFGACFVYFESDRTKWKLTPAGHPELWFFVGRASPPPTIKWASTIQSFFDKVDAASFREKPSLDGKVLHYEYTKGGENWLAVCMGFELGAITSQEILKSQVVEPLIKAATEAGIFDVRTKGNSGLEAGRPP